MKSNLIFSKALHAILTICIVLVTFPVAFVALTGATAPFLFEPMVRKDPNWDQGPLLGGIQAMPQFLLTLFFAGWFTVLVLRLRKKSPKPFWPGLFTFALALLIATTLLYGLGRYIGLL